MPVYDRCGALGRLAAVSAAILAGCTGAHAQSPNYNYLYRVSNFVSVVGPSPYNDPTKGDRYFTSCGFQGLSFTMNSSNVSQFNDGQLRWDAYGSYPARTYNWNDLVPADLGGTDNSPWDPDRGDTGTPYANEPGFARLGDIFSGGNINRILDGERNVANAYVDLYFGNGKFVQSDGNGETPELVLLERGGNSGVYLRAIRSDGTYSNELAVNLRSGTRTTRDPHTHRRIAMVGGSCGFSLDSMEIGSAEPVYGTGIDLLAFGDVGTGDKIIGYQIWFEKGNGFCDGPDLHGFILSKEASEVPEASTLAGLAMMLGSGGGLAAQASGLTLVQDTPPTRPAYQRQLSWRLRYVGVRDLGVSFIEYHDGGPLDERSPLSGNPLRIAQRPDLNAGAHLGIAPGLIEGHDGRRPLAQAPNDPPPAVRHQYRRALALPESEHCGFGCRIASEGRTATFDGVQEPCD